MKKLFILTLFIVCANVFPKPLASPIWQDVESERTILSKSSAKSFFKRRLLSLDEEKLKQVLISSADNSNGGTLTHSAKALQTNIELPLPNGGFVRVHAVRYSVLSEEIAKKHPEIQTWKIQGVDDSFITGRLDFTPKGFHGLLTLADGDSVYIDPVESSSSPYYQSMSKAENSSHFNTSFNCKVHKDHSLFQDSSLPTTELKKSLFKSFAPISVQSIVTYRLAIAGTAEYTASQGGSKASAFSSIVTTINRVNQVYQSDLGIQLQLVSGEELLYTDSVADPYTNSSALLMINENIDNLTTTLGVNNYDIGHVFAQGNQGGLSLLGVACQDSVNKATGVISGLKGGGVTGISNPRGEIFSMFYVAHEIGHQLGATHTFNGTQGACSGGRTQETAVEPGSGSTIMSYGGFCGSDNLQSGTDAMFHGVSIGQINAYLGSQSCGTQSSQLSTLNVDAGNDITIPISTPYLLDGSASSGSSFTWDQMDAGSSSAVNIDSGDNAIVRTLLPSSNPNRFIPNLRDLFYNRSSIGEVLPQTERVINYALVTRGSGVDSAYKKVTAIDTGKFFKVISQATPETLIKGQEIDVVWEVAATDIAPINCNDVDIKLLRVSGDENILLENTANDGFETLVIPLTTPEMRDARIMVSCKSQSFFQISAGAISIQEKSIDITPPVITLNGEETIELVQGAEYIEQGASVFDNVDKGLTVNISGDVDTNIVAKYKVSYLATDLSANKTVVERYINVIEPPKKAITVTPKVPVIAPVIIDTKAPIISLKGETKITIERDKKYKESGYSAIDDNDGVVEVIVSGSVNVNTIGKYTLIYKAKDKAGNESSKQRVITVILPPLKTVVVKPKVEPAIKYQSAQTSGGSTSFILFPLLLLGLLRRFRNNIIC